MPNEVRHWRCQCGNDLFIHVAGGFIEEFKEEVKGGIKSRMRWKEYEHDMVICPKCGTAQNRFIEPEWLK